MSEMLADRYELGEELGSGGMGRVVRAHDQALGREVAVKLLHENLARQPRVRERFMREARSAVRFSHPNAVAVYDAGTQGRTPYIVMELIEGSTLADELAEHGPLPPERATRIAKAVLAALEAAHANGLVHRDVKPANIMLTRKPDADDHDHGNGQATESVKLTDFGIAKGLADAGDKLTATGQVFGTPHYLAPEQAEGKAASPASDVYAMGVVCYEMLAGEPPFTGDSAIAVILAHQQDEPQPLRRRRRDIDPALASVVHRALQKEPEARYADAAQMRAALAELSHVRTSGRPATSTAARAAATTRAVSPRASTPARPVPAPPRRRQWSRWWLAAAAAALLVLALVGFVIASDEPIEGLDAGGIDDPGEEQGDEPADPPPATDEGGGPVEEDSTDEDSTDEQEPAQEDQEPAPEEPSPAPEGSQPAPEEPSPAPEDSQPAPEDGEPAPDEAPPAPDGTSRESEGLLDRVGFSDDRR